MSVSKITTSASALTSTTFLGKTVERIGNTKIIRSLADKAKNDSVKFACDCTLISIVSKDAIGCVMYVWQSLNNKRIPEDKRKFVASVDLANGAIMIGFQLLAYKTLDTPNFQDKLFNRTLGKYFDHNNQKAHRHVLENVEKSMGKDGLNTGRLIMNDSFLEAQKTSKGALKKLIPLIAAAIIAKRVFAPFFSVPLADYLRKYIFNDDPNAKKPTCKDATDPSKLYEIKLFGSQYRPMTEVIREWKSKQNTNNQQVQQSSIMNKVI